MSPKRTARASRRFVLAALAVLGLLTTPVGQATAPFRLQPDNADRALNGVVDIHVHSLPDDRPRSIDAIEIAKLARSRGMRGIVLKNHNEPTASLAFIVRKEVPGLEVFGGIGLNRTVGGINVRAVEHMTLMTGGWGRFVWMPTGDAENQVRYSKQNRPFVSVSRGGELLPEVKDVIAVIAKNQLVLATGHSSAEEALMLVREGRRQGVQHMVITHPMLPVVNMSVPQMQEATKQGAFLEFIYLSIGGRNPQFKITDYATVMRQVGSEFCILSSDLGQVGDPVHTDGLAAFIAALRAQGFTEQEVDRMSKQNPARLLGLP